MDAVLAEEHILLHLTTVFPQHLQRNSQQTETTIKEKSQLKLNIHKFFCQDIAFPPRFQVQQMHQVAQHTTSTKQVISESL